MKTQQITIVGLDQIGTSVGLALKNSLPDITIIGHDPDRDKSQNALKQKAIDKAEWNLVKAVMKADILVIHVPVSQLELTIQTCGDAVQEHTLILDMSELKHRGQKWASKYLKQGHYVGARPALSANAMKASLAGNDEPNADLFHQSVFCIMPSPKADPQAVETAVKFGHLLGATPYFLDASEYDGLLHGIETLPSLMSVALFNAIQQSTGWRDMLRFAGPTFNLATSPLQNAQDMAHLAMDNQIVTLRWLEALSSEIDRIRQWIHNGDAETLAAIWEEMAIEREKWLHERAENNWIDLDNDDVDIPSFGQRMLGRIGDTNRRKN